MENPNLKIINMEDIETENVSWLMKPYIPFGKITVVQGDPGKGKTTMMLAIAAERTNGAVNAMQQLMMLCVENHKKKTNFLKQDGLFNLNYRADTLSLQEL